ncbi:MAG: HD domain-containing protein [Methanobacteriota archaeon]|nr:MAG: HD domain-containing protein [Euryarchaeota archaeon]
MAKRNRAVRDPIHNYIHLSLPESALIDSPFLQRLRWVSQLSGVKLVFPGGTHNRLPHVMGVMHLAGEYASHIFADLKKSEREHKTQLARLAGLLHDVAHGAFSHAYDDTVYRALYPGNPHGHDTHRYKLIKSDYLKPLIQACGVEPEEIIDLWEGKDTVLQAIVQGALGADRMDFMLRDSYYAGTTHFGTVASTRIISSTHVKEHDGALALHYDVKVLDDIFQALLGRFYMYRGVYFHKASSAADIMIRHMLAAAMKPLQLPERTADFEQFQYINDYTVVGEIMTSQAEGIEEAREYCTRLLQRKLPKLIWETIVSESVVRTVNTDIEKGSKIIAQSQFLDKLEEEAERLGKPMPRTYIFNTYPMSTIDHDEFNAGNIFIWDEKERLVPGKKSITFEEAIRSTNYFKPFLVDMEDRQRYIMIRVYADPEDAKWIRKLKIGIPPPKQPNLAETSY